MTERSGLSSVIGVVLLVLVVVALVGLLTVVLFGFDEDVGSAKATVDMTETTSGLNVNVIRNDNVEEFIVKGPNNEEITRLTGVGDTANIKGISGTYSVVAIVNGEEQVLREETIETTVSGLFVVDQNGDEKQVFASLKEDFAGVDEYEIAVEFENSESTLLSTSLSEQGRLLDRETPDIIDKGRKNTFGLVGIRPNGSGNIRTIGEDIPLHEHANLCEGDKVYLTNKETNKVISSETITVNINCDDIRSVAEYDESGQYIEAMSFYNPFNKDSQYTAFGVGDNTVEAFDNIEISAGSTDRIQFQSSSITAAASSSDGYSRTSISSGSSGSTSTGSSFSSSNPYITSSKTTTTLGRASSTTTDGSTDTTNSFNPPSGQKPIELSNGVIPVGESLFVNAWIGTSEQEAQTDTIEVYTIPLNENQDTTNVNLNQTEPRSTQTKEIQPNGSTQTEFEFVFNDSEVGKHLIVGSLQSNDRVVEAGVIEVIDNSFTNAEFEYINTLTSNPQNNTQFDVAEVKLNQSTFDISNNELLTVDLFKNGDIVESKDTDGTDSLTFTDTVTNTGIVEYQVGIRQARNIQYVDSFSIGEDDTTQNVGGQTVELITDVKVNSDSCISVEQPQSNCHIKNGETVSFSMADTSIQNTRITGYEWIIDGETVESGSLNTENPADIPELQRTFDESGRYIIQAQLQAESTSNIDQEIQITSDDSISTSVDPSNDEFTVSIENAQTVDEIIKTYQTTNSDVTLNTQRVIESEPVYVRFKAPEIGNNNTIYSGSYDVNPTGTNINVELNPNEFVPEDSIDSDRSVPVELEVTEVNGDGKLTEEFTIETIKQFNSPDVRVSNQTSLVKAVQDETVDKILVEENENGNVYSFPDINQDNKHIVSDGCKNVQFSGEYTDISGENVTLENLCWSDGDTLIYSFGKNLTIDGGSYTSTLGYNDAVIENLESSLTLKGGVEINHENYVGVETDGSMTIENATFDLPDGDRLFKGQGESNVEIGDVHVENGNILRAIDPTLSNGDTIEITNEEIIIPNGGIITNDLDEYNGGGRSSNYYYDGTSAPNTVKITSFSGSTLSSLDGFSKSGESIKFNSSGAFLEDRNIQVTNPNYAVNDINTDDLTVTAKGSCSEMEFSGEYTDISGQDVTLENLCWSDGDTLIYSYTKNLTIDGGSYTSTLGYNDAVIENLESSLTLTGDVEINHENYVGVETDGSMTVQNATFDLPDGDRLFKGQGESNVEIGDVHVENGNILRAIDPTLSNGDTVEITNDKLTIPGGGVITNDLDEYNGGGRSSNYYYDGTGATETVNITSFSGSTLSSLDGFSKSGESIKFNSSGAFLEDRNIRVTNPNYAVNNINTDDLTVTAKGSCSEIQFSGEYTDISGENVTLNNLCWSDGDTLIYSFGKNLTIDGGNYSSTLGYNDAVIENFESSLTLTGDVEINHDNYIGIEVDAPMTIENATFDLENSNDLIFSGSASEEVTIESVNIISGRCPDYHQSSC